MSLYYERMTQRVLVHGLDNVPFLLHSRWLGQKVNSIFHLRVEHPDGKLAAKVLCSFFQDVLWDDVQDSERDPFRKARLRLRGKLKNKDIFGLLEIDLGALRALALTLSPVPFGLNGCPILPYKDDQLRLLLACIKEVTSTMEFGCMKSVDWTNKRLAKTIQVSLGLASYEFDEGKAAFFLGEMQELALVEKDQRCQIYQSTMGPDRFREIFGVELPS